MSLTGRRVLVVEDEALVLMSLEETLDAFGCDVVSAMRVDDALAKAANLAFDIAVLDVNVAGTFVYPVAELLAERGIPFIFATGYQGLALPSHLRAEAVLNKPYVSADLKAALLTGLRRTH